MDGQTLEQMRNVLLSRWERLDKENRSTEQLAAEIEGTTSAELIDIAQALEQMGRDSSLKEAERRELLAVERALAKMATGRFGICEDCGEEILAKRLLVLPEARLCSPCQTFEERQNVKMNLKARMAG
jgi:DnaK suppressor protein